MQEIGGALEHLVLAAEDNKDVVTKLTEAHEALTRKNASLKMQLSDAMKINLEMAKKLNFKVTQNPEDKKLVDKAKNKASFESSLHSKGYCWTHRYRFTKLHSSQTCSAPAADHQRQAIQKYIIVGSEAGK